MAKHTMQDLKLYQALPLDVKIQMTKNRIRGWVREYGENGVYVSFSGGKDSTVLLDIVREDYPNIPAVFIDVPTQYPELKSFAKEFAGDNLTILKPQLSFMQVCEKYGFPIFSKENSDAIYGARKYLKELDRMGCLRQNPNRQTDRQIAYAYHYRAIRGIGEYANKDGTSNGNTNKRQQEESEYP